MALTDEQAWTLTAAGLIALADGVLKGGEASRILGLVDERLEPAEQDAWIDRLADARALWEHAVALPRLPAERAPQVLHDAWAIALVDGEGSTEEVQVLERIGALLGVDREQLTAWRTAWTTQAGELAQLFETLVASLYRVGEGVVELSARSERVAAGACLQHTTLEGLGTDAEALAALGRPLVRALERGVELQQALASGLDEQRRLLVPSSCPGRAYQIGSV